MLEATFKNQTMESYSEYIIINKLVCYLMNIYLLSDKGQFALSFSCYVKILWLS